MTSNLNLSVNTRLFSQPKMNSTTGSNISVTRNESVYAACTAKNPCTYEDLTFLPGMTILFDILYIIIIIFAVIGNVLVILTVYRNKGMHTVPNVHLVNLAITDLLVAMFVMPLKLIEYGAARDVNVFVDGVCSAMTYTLPIFVFAGVYTLVTLSIERYYAIVHPFRSLKINTVSRTIKLMAGIWLTAFVIPVPFLINSKRYPVVHSSQHGLVSRVRCDNDFEEIDAQLGAPKESFRTGFYSVLCLINFVIPTVILVYTSVRITVVLLKTRKSDHVVIRRHNTLQRREVGKRKVAKMVVVITAAFIISWFPFYLVNILSITKAVDFQGGQFYFTMLFVHLMAFVNSVVTPVIFTAMSSNFRRKCFNIISNIFFCCRYYSMLKKARSTSKLSRTVDTGVHMQTGESSLKGDQVIVNLKTFETQNKEAVSEHCSSEVSITEPSSSTSASANFYPKRFAKPTLSYSGPSDLKEYKKYLRKLSKTSAAGSVNSLTDLNDKLILGKLGRKKKISTVSLPPGTPKLSQADLENWRGSLNCLLDIRLADEKKAKDDISGDPLHLDWDNSVDLENAKVEEEKLKNSDSQNDTESELSSLPNFEKQESLSTITPDTEAIYFPSTREPNDTSKNILNADEPKDLSVSISNTPDQQGVSNSSSNDDEDEKNHKSSQKEGNLSSSVNVAKGKIGKHEIIGPRDSGIFSATPSESGKSTPRLLPEFTRDQPRGGLDNQTVPQKTDELHEKTDIDKPTTETNSQSSLLSADEFKEIGAGITNSFGSQYSRHLGPDYVEIPTDKGNCAQTNFRELNKDEDSKEQNMRHSFIPQILVHSPETEELSTGPAQVSMSEFQAQNPSDSPTNDNLHANHSPSNYRCDILEQNPPVPRSVDTSVSKQVKIPLRYKGYTRVDANGKPIYITVNRDVAFSTTYGLSAKHVRKRHRNNSCSQMSRHNRTKFAADKKRELPCIENLLLQKSEKRQSDIAISSPLATPGLKQSHFLCTGQSNPSFCSSEEDLPRAQCQTGSLTNSLRSRSAHNLGEYYNEYTEELDDGACDAKVDPNIKKQVPRHKEDRPNITINVILPSAPHGIGNFETEQRSLLSSQRISVSASKLLEDLFASDNLLYNGNDDVKSVDAVADVTHTAATGESQMFDWQLPSTPKRRSSSSDSIHKIGFPKQLHQGAFAPVSMSRGRQPPMATQISTPTAKNPIRRSSRTLDIDTEVPYLTSSRSCGILPDPAFSKRFDDPFDINPVLSTHSGSGDIQRVNRRKVTPVLQEAAARLQNLATNQNELCSTRNAFVRKPVVNKPVPLAKPFLETQIGLYTKPTEV
ncbi:uncharacterized protein LOC106157778 [Lingula anatina]|uniref:Uncharacterized protein LOC106157778 n=1 Tax=Lingula anatina TaxID=7574 RepID=A0A1S3HSH5_LINAN|nr:uncharacterized protein LOC106157778 [Lingula anatina]|eukprot:XP_013388978.1 uncharacterized protein LOC106157778 [Lingula anatina]